MNPRGNRKKGKGKKSLSVDHEPPPIRFYEEGITQTGLLTHLIQCTETFASAPKYTESLLHWFTIIDYRKIQGALSSLSFLRLLVGAILRSGGLADKGPAPQLVELAKSLIMTEFKPKKSAMSTATQMAAPQPPQVKLFVQLCMAPLEGADDAMAAVATELAGKLITVFLSRLRMHGTNEVRLQAHVVDNMMAMLTEVWRHMGKPGVFDGESELEAALDDIDELLASWAVDLRAGKPNTDNIQRVDSKEESAVMDVGRGLGVVHGLMRRTLQAPGQDELAVNTRIELLSGFARDLLGASGIREDACLDDVQRTLGVVHMTTKRLLELAPQLASRPTYARVVKNLAVLQKKVHMEKGEWTRIMAVPSLHGRLPPVHAQAATDDGDGNISSPTLKTNMGLTGRIRGGGSPGFKKKGGGDGPKLGVQKDKRAMRMVLTDE